MSVAQAIEYLRYWTEADYFALGEDEGNRVELFDGSLLVSPRARKGHQHLAYRLWSLLEAALPPNLDVAGDIDVRLRTGRIMAPDVVVTTELGDPKAHPANTVVLAAEVVSPYGGRRDRVLKYRAYAAAGIPRYLIIDSDGPVASLHVLHGDTYVEAGRARPGQLLRIDQPRFDLDPADLLRRVGGGGR